ncbi:MAG: hypothetical protein QM639_04100, partial [Rhodocyclaceae bacterium]
MNARRLLACTFAFSIAFHLGMLVAPAWHLPEEKEPPLRIDAKLLQMPAAAPPPQAAPPKPRPKPPAPAAE